MSGASKLTEVNGDGGVCIRADQVSQLVRGGRQGQFATTGVAVMLTTHNPADVAACDEVLVLGDDGTAAFGGTPQEVCAHFGVGRIEEIYVALAQRRGETIVSAVGRSATGDRRPAGSLSVPRPTVRRHRSVTVPTDASAPVPRRRLRGALRDPGAGHGRRSRAGTSLLGLSGLTGLRRGNGAPMGRIYGPGDVRDRGGTVSLNLLDPQGVLVDERLVAAESAAEGISLRTGCFCNPGEGAFELTRGQLKGSRGWVRRPSTSTWSGWTCSPVAPCGCRPAQPRTSPTSNVSSVSCAPRTAIGRPSP